ncbi:MAG: NUDIX domain-containing protein, partial [Methyloceanibacter sp.]
MQIDFEVLYSRCSISPSVAILVRPLIGKAVGRPFLRLQRGLTLGAQGVVIDQDDRILLVRHTYRPGWFFPGGGVEWNETLGTALARELEEEVGVSLTGPTQLHGVFA